MRALLLALLLLAAAPAYAQQEELCSTYGRLDVAKTTALVSREVKRVIADTEELKGKLKPIMSCMRGYIEAWHREVRLYCAYDEDPTDYLTIAYQSALETCSLAADEPPVHVLPELTVVTPEARAQIRARVQGRARK